MYRIEPPAYVQANSYRGLFLLTEEHNEYDKYENLKISDNSWLVRMKGNLDDLRQSTLFNVHPIYSRIRTVTVHDSILNVPARCLNVSDSYAGTCLT